MNLGNVYTIVRKELLETLRDKRTLVAMIGVPIVIYPLMFILVTQATLIQQSKTEEKISRIYLPADAPESVRAWIQSVEKVKVVECDQPEDKLLSGDIDAVVDPCQLTDSLLAGNGTAPIKIKYDNTEPDSRKAMIRIRDALRTEEEKVLARRLAEVHLREEFVHPLKIQIENVAPPAKTTGTFLGTVLPLLLVIMLAVGAFYPAVDLTAGEKERGTFETLLSTPTSKMEIVTGKFITVFSLSLFTGLLNLVSMTLTLTFQISQLAGQMGDSGDIALAALKVSPANLLIMFLILIPLAFFICSVMMAIALFARSFKEAQNYVTPFYIIILLPGMVAGLPGVELSSTTMLIPIANVELLLKDLLIQKFSFELFFGVFLSTAAYALLALLLAVRIFQSEEVILSEEKGVPFSFRRADFLPRRTPTPGMSLFLFVFMLIMLFYLGSYVQNRDIISGIFITEFGILLLPTLLLLWFIKVDLRETLRLRAPSPGAIVSAVLIAFGMLVLILQISVWQGRILPMPEKMARLFSEMFTTGDTMSDKLLLLAAVGVSPAICEEILFRGAILSGIRSKLSLPASIVLVGILFGLFHVNIYRLMPTAILGMMITWLVLRSGSIFTGMLAHLINNTTLMLAQTALLPQPIMQFIDRYQVDKNGFPAWLLLTALGMVVLGIFLMETKGTKKSASAEE